MASRFQQGPCNATLLTGTSAVTIGGAGAGAGGIEIVGVVILLNAAAVTATIAGFADQSGSAQNILLTGQTGSDTVYMFPAPLVGPGTVTVTPSVTQRVLVLWNSARG